MIFGVNLRDWDKAKEDPELIQNIEVFSILAFPGMLVTIDEIFWNIGKTYGSKNNPRCSECPMSEICDHAKKTQASYK
ncbi:MAG: hypothetical protein QW154_06290 [Sulfolobales archaeon]